jgi:hypothetical protein
VVRSGDVAFSLINNKLSGKEDLKKDRGDINIRIIYRWSRPPSNLTQSPLFFLAKITLGGILFSGFAVRQATPASPLFAPRIEPRPIK